MLLLWQVAESSWGWPETVTTVGIFFAISLALAVGFLAMAWADRKPK